MRIAILANDNNSFVKPMAEGLARMAQDCGAEVELRYDGLSMLSLPLRPDISSVRRIVGTATRLAGRKKLFARFVDRIASCDAVVVVANVPASFAVDSYQNIETLRERLPAVPIINYDLHYLPTIDKWSQAILGKKEAGLTAEDMHFIRHGAFGMERFDWYLMASVVSSIPLHPPPHPFTIVGLDLNDGTLFPEQHGETRALLDFAQLRLDYPSYRIKQIEALERTDTPYEVLDGSYTIDAIRAVYRRTAIFMLASKESFGLPICELQACGSYIFMPHSRWAEAHWMKDDLSRGGPGTLSSNFIVYDDDVEKLMSQIQQVRANYDPLKVIDNLRSMQPQLFFGDRAAMSEFLGMLEDGTIHSRLHNDHRSIGC